MTFLLMILVPCAIAVGCMVIRPHTRLAVQAALATIAVELIFLVRLPLDEPVRSLGLAYVVDAPGQVLIGALLIAIGSAYVAWTAVPVGGSAPASLLVVLGLGIGALLLEAVVPALILTLMAAIVGLLQIVDAPSGGSALLHPSSLVAAVARLVALVAGTALLVMSYTLVPSAPAVFSFSTVLLWAGLVIWVGFVPFHFPLASVADNTTPLAFVGGVVVPQAIVLACVQRFLSAQVGAVGVTHTLLVIVAGITIVGAPMLARGTVRRAVAFVLLANAGQVVLGILLNVWTGGGGVSLVAAHVLSATLICSSIALLEAHVPGQSNAREPWRDRPIAAAGLVIGLLMLLGVPGLGGFAPKFSLWQVAWQDGALAIGVVIIGTLLLVVASFRLASALLFIPAERREADRRAHWRRRVAPVGTPVSEVTMLPVVVPPYAPVVLRGWTVLLIVIAVAAAIDTLLPS